MNCQNLMDEHSYLKRIREIASKNKMFKTYMGLGYYNTIFAFGDPA